MPRLPAGVRWWHLGCLVLAVGTLLWVAKDFAERQRVVTLLDRHIKDHPEDAQVAQVVIDCNRGLVFHVDVDECGATLLKRFGPDVLGRLAKMQAEGAFGR